MKKLILLGIALAGLAGTAKSQAGVSFDITLGDAYPHRSPRVCEPVIPYYTPAPQVYVAPPPPVYVVPAPRYEVPRYEYRHYRYGRERYGHERPRFEHSRR